MALVTIIFLAVLFFVIIFMYSILLQNSSRLLKLAIIFIVVFLGIVGLTLCATLIELENVSSYDKLGPFGDYVGGILNPLISGFAVFAAGFAFYAQYQANKQVQKQFNTQQFESQFYERFRLIKDEIETAYLVINNGKEISGRKVFYELDKEIKYIYFILSSHVKYLDEKTLFIISYEIFFSGKKSFFSNKNNLKPNNIYKILPMDMVFLEMTFDEEFDFLKNNINKPTNELRTDTYYYDFNYLEGISIKHLPFKGMQTKISIVVRQIFSLVKFVTNNETFSYEEKRNYLRVLRSILSNYEQLHIFYNWYSNIGSAWENGDNKFLTDFRMIHNLPPNLLIKEIKLEDIFNLTSGYLKESGRNSDSLFEFQD